MSQGNYDDLLDHLRGEFIGEAEDCLNEMEIALQQVRSGQLDPTEAIILIRRPAHSLKGSAGVADFPLVAVLMHRLEDYLADVQTLTEQHLHDVNEYLEKTREYSTLEIDQNSISSADLVRSLPGKRSEAAQEAPTEATAANLEAMLVIREKTAGKLFERELIRLGLRVTTVRSSFEALEMVVRMKPDLLLVSGVLDELSGVDVAAAIAAMPNTRNTRIGVLTSFDRDHPELRGLPASTAIIHKSSLLEDIKPLLSGQAAAA